MILDADDYVQSAWFTFLHPPPPSSLVLLNDCFPLDVLFPSFAVIVFGFVVSTSYRHDPFHHPRLMTLSFHTPLR
jgi:hypothetical protein